MIGEVAMLYIADKVASQLIKDEGYGYIRSKLFTKKYRNRLVQIIYKVQNEYEQRFPFDYSNSAHPFYKTERVYNFLLRYILLKNDSVDGMTIESFQDIPDVTLPTQEELREYFNLFKERASEDGMLKNLFAAENYKVRIIEASADISKIKIELREIKAALIWSEVPVLHGVHVTRPVENALLETINEKNSVLLTGISFCGKSELAKSLSKILFKKGFAFRIGSDIESARDFLRIKGEKRLFLLEDPFGHDSEDEKKYNWRKLQDLIKGLNTESKIIVTSRIEQLRKIRDVEDIIECSIEGNMWVDLTNRNREFLREVWSKLSVSSNLPDNVITSIDDYLKGQPENELIQVGQLAYLSNYPKEKLEGLGISELLHIARNDSKDIALEISSRGDYAKSVYIALGILGSTNVIVQLEHLKQVLRSQSSLPGFEERNTLRTYTFDKSEKDAHIEFPEYEQKQDECKELLDELTFLEGRGLINHLSRDEVLFRHPTYLEASRYLQLNVKLNFLDELKRLFINSLSNLDYEGALNASQQLEINYKNASSEEVQSILIDVAFEAITKSIYPGVKDESLTFLLNGIDELSPRKQARVLRELSPNSLDYYLQWNNDVPFFRNSKFPVKKIRLPGSDKINESLVQLLNQEQEVPRQKVWELLIAAKWEKIELSVTGAHFVFQLKEAFIRTKAVYGLFRFGCPHKDIIEMAFSDRHPGVIFEAIKAVIYGYSNYSQTDKELIKPYLLNALDDKHVVVRANELLATFAIDYGNESIIPWKQLSEDDKKELWLIWSELFPKFIQNFPTGIRTTNSGRFSVTLDEARKNLEGKSMIPICEAFFIWIENYLKWGVPDSHEFGLIQLLITSTEGIKSDRFDLFKRINGHNDSNFSVYSICWSIGYWDVLTPSEQDFLIEVIKDKKRSDNRWIQASLLSSASLPERVIESILEDASTFKKSPEDFINSLSTQMFTDTLNIVLRKNERTTHLAVSNPDRVFWNSVMTYLMNENVTDCVELAINEFINDGLQGQTEEWINYFQILNDLCKTQIKESILDTFIEEYSHCASVISCSQKMWEIILSNHKEGDLKKLVKKVISNIDKIHRHEPNDFIDVFGWEFITKNIIPALPFDEKIMTLSSFILNEETKGHEQEIIKEIDEILELSKIQVSKLEGSINILKAAIREKQSEFNELNKLEEINRPHLNLEYREKWYFTDLEGWVDSPTEE